MRADRLRKLAHFLLDDVLNDHFDVEAWGRKGFTSHECGSAACALGWATACFPGEGLTMDYSEAGDGGGTVVYGAAFGFDAARRFFEIPSRHATWLFSSPGGREEVAQRLLDYVRDPGGVYRTLVRRSLQLANRPAPRPEC